MTTQATAANATDWSRHSMARKAGISETSLRHIWHAHGLKPHRVESFKIGNDPDFAAKLEDVVGLYLNPAEHALVLSVDENSGAGPYSAWTALEKGTLPDHDSRLPTQRNDDTALHERSAQTYS
jgi:hypothetical protein